MEPASRIERARRGDPRAWEELVGKHGAKLRLYVGFRLGPALARRVEVDDVVQETLLRAWRDLPRAALSGDDALGGWLAAIARHVIVDVARAARRQGTQALLERSAWSRAGALDPADATAGPATRAARGEEHQRLLAAYRSLSPRHRRVIALRQFEQRSARESAPLLGCTELAVHALFRRALDAWGRALDGPGVPTP